MSKQKSQGAASKYNHKLVEKKWQEIWKKKRVFSPDVDKSGKHFYNLWMFPYPSGEGLHAGHAFASTGSDVFGRYMRMNDKSVFQPIGYDSFGIHGENFALKLKKHPMELIKKTTKNYERQLRSLGHAYDWTRTVTTSDIDYYRWTQWLFVQLFKAGLAYRKEAEVNWCPSCKTVLADEQVMTPAQAGKEPRGLKKGQSKEDVQVCERCGTVVERKSLAQWFFRITDYADKLLGGLKDIDWPEKIKLAQKNWIGKKEGITIKYKLKAESSKLKTKFVTCWTSRPDTNFGATFIVVSPEYAQETLIDVVGDKHKVSCKKYIKESLSKPKQDRISEGRGKTGVFTGLYAINQLNGYKMPVWIADFVLSDVGTGAVVGVPGHDKRDFEFAKKFGLEIKRVVVGKDKDITEITKAEQVQEDEGIMVNSEFLDGLDIHKATKKIVVYLVKKGWGEQVANYHLRDWLISRQRYWGPPIPMIYCKTCAKRGDSWFTENLKSESLSTKHIRNSMQSMAGWYPEEHLPVELPNIKDYKPKGTGRGPLSDHPEFYKVSCPECGKVARRETDVSDTFLDSAWYFLRYPSVSQIQNSKVKSKNHSLKSKNNLEIRNSKLEIPWNQEVTKAWLPVDLYFGGAEHAVLHLMYARFMTMAMHDLGHLEFSEPFPKFFAHGLMIKDGAKMSKSRGNVVNPDEYIEKFGADTLRLYLMFLGPMDGYPDFRDTGIEGMRRFIERIWDLLSNHSDVILIEEKDTGEVMVKTHQTIKKVTEDMQEFKYNTSIAAIMELVNVLRDKSENANTKRANGGIKCAEWDLALTNLTLLIAPFTPHLAEEVWSEILGKKDLIQEAKWPKYIEEFIKEETVEIPVQVNGRLRSTISVGRKKAKDKKYMISLAKKDQKVLKWLKGKQIKREIFVPGKLLNIVV